MNELPKRRYKNEKYAHLASVDHLFEASVNDENSEASLTIYGDIGESWWGESTSAKDIEQALKNVSSTTLTVHLNSGGGDVFDGIAIYNQLKNHSAKVIVHVDGLAASAASLIAMAGDEIIMHTGSIMMIHEASTWSWGTKTDMKKTLNALESIDKSIADIYMTRFVGEKSDIEALITAETWLTADEAVQVGLADSVEEKDEEEEREKEEDDPEVIKNNILAKFKNQVTPTKQTILAKLQRNSME